jgi:hypothetical protein
MTVKEREAAENRRSGDILRSDRHEDLTIW